MRLGFLKERRGGIGPVKKACGSMKVSKSGSCEHLGRRKPNARIGREALEGLVVGAFGRHKGRHGYRRINRELRRSGIAVGERRAPRIMREPGLAGKGAARKHRIQRKAEPGDPRLNPVERAFAVGGRDRLRAGGVACMPTREGRLHLAAVTDAFSRKAVGRPMPGHAAGKAAVDAMGGRSAGRARRMAAASSSMTAKARGTPPAPSGGVWARMA